ncbi:MAG TPA: ABC transporter permease [Terriglobia bacterium]|nr:ABC transporter permease [Terriglobia bacterium]
MSWKRQFAKLGNLFTRGRRTADLDDEIRSHLRMEEQENLESGMTPEEAHYAALRRFGNVTLAQERSREMWGWNSLEALLQDLRYGLRQLGRNPGFTAVAVLTLALGIGANTAIFSAVNGIWLEPLIYARSSRLVTADLLPIPEIQAIQKQSTAFERMAIYQKHSCLVLGGAVPVRTANSYVSDDFFPLLGVKPLLGRPILPGDTQPGNALVAVISYRLWMDEFGDDPHIVGRSVSVDHKPFTVIGVMPKGFDLGVTWGGGNSGLWMPFVYSPPDSMNLGPTSSFVARLKKGVTLSQAKAQLEAISARLAAEYPNQYPKALRGYGRIVTAGVSGRTDPGVRLALLILLGAVGFILLMACVNVASLLVARSWTRQRELAIRKALGASRLRIVRQLLSESLLLAVSGGTLGLFFSAWGIRLLQVIAPPYTPRVDHIRLDGNVLWFTMGITLLAAVLVGLAPAMHASSRRVGGTLEGGLVGAFAGAEMRQSHRFRSALVILEVALAVIVVTGGALMARSFYKLMSVNTGVRADHVLTMHVQLSDLACNGLSFPTRNPKESAVRPRSTAQANQLQKQITPAAGCALANEDILDGIRSLAGVQRAACAGMGPLQGGVVTTSVRYPGAPSGMGLYVEGQQGNQLTSGAIEGRSVTPGFFAALGIRLLKGRDFVLADLNHSDVAIVSEGFARKYIPGNPLRKRFSIAEDEKGHHRWMEIVGVVNDVRDRAVHESTPGPAYYTPFFFGDNWGEIIVRTSTNPMVIVHAIERVVRFVDADAAITHIETLDQIIADSAAEPKFQTVLLASFGALGFLLAVIGVYGVVSYSAVQRTHEIGVRIALGAKRGDILRMVLREGMLLAGIGITAGISGALALTRFLRSLLFEITPTDPPTFIGVSVILTAVVLLASYIPARRATKVDPMVALRHE